MGCQMRRMLTVVLLAVGMVVGATSVAQAARPDALVLPGDAYFPESITAGDGALFVSSITTGEIVKFPPGSSRPQTFVSPGVDIGTAGVMADTARNVLWACAVDLSFRTASYLRAFDLRTGALKASYQMPDNGVCADIALGHGGIYVT